MVGRENTGLFCRSLYGDLYGDTRFGAVRRIRLWRWVLKRVMRMPGAEPAPPAPWRAGAALLLPANNDVAQAIRRFDGEAECHGLARRTGRRGRAGHFVFRVAARGVGYRQYGVMLFNVVKRQARALPVRYP